MQNETLAQEFARLTKAYKESDMHIVLRAWHRLADCATANADVISAALSDKRSAETFTREQMLAEVERRVERALAARSALSGQQAVEVKALEQSIMDAIDEYRESLPGTTFGPLEWPTIDGIKAAIRSALVDVPAVEPVAWRVIEGYEGLYEVSSGGDVRSIQTGKLLAKNLAGSGYVKADLWKNGKRWQTTVHRLVADAFLEKQGTEINHINGVKTDNRVDNLEWCTRSENVSHSVYVLSNRVRPVVAYNPATGETRHYRSVCEAARDGFKSSQIYRALKNPNRSVKGFRWQEAHLSPALAATRSGSATTQSGNVDG